MTADTRTLQARQISTSTKNHAWNGEITYHHHHHDPVSLIGFSRGTRALVVLRHSRGSWSRGLALSTVGSEGSVLLSCCDIGFHIIRTLIHEDCRTDRGAAFVAMFLLTSGLAPLKASVSAAATFPSNYPDFDTCSIRVAEGNVWAINVVCLQHGVLFTNALIVNGIAYSGADGPQEIVPEGTIQWSSEAR